MRRARLDEIIAEILREVLADPQDQRPQQRTDGRCEKRLKAPRTDFPQPLDRRDRPPGKDCGFLKNLNAARPVAFKNGVNPLEREILTIVKLTGIPRDLGLNELSPHPDAVSKRGRPSGIKEENLDLSSRFEKFPLLNQVFRFENERKNLSMALLLHLRKRNDLTLKTEPVSPCEMGNVTVG